MNDLTKSLSEPDLWLRIQAANALAAIGRDARSAVPEMLKLAARRDSSDPRGMTQRYLAFALFQKRADGLALGLISGSLEGVDRKELDEAVVAILTNEDGRARGSISSIFSNLRYEEIKPLMPAIRNAIANQAPSGIMFADRMRLDGLAYLAKHHISDGIELSVKLIEPDRWGQGRRWAPCLNALVSYGSAAQSQLPALREMEAFMIEKGKSNDPNMKLLQKAIQDIESATKAPKLNDLPKR